MSYSLTIFRSIFDNKTSKRMDFDSWEKMESLLYGLSGQPGYKPKRGEKPTQEPSVLISPAIYRPGTTRANANVTAWAGWAALDVDNYSRNAPDIQKVHADKYFVCYSTASCRAGGIASAPELKFRLVFPLTKHVPVEKIRHFWYALNKECGAVGDEQTKDLSRMYYVPAIYPKAFNFIFTHKAAFMDPDALMAKHPYTERGVTFLDRLPPEIQKSVMEYRKQGMTKGNYQWTSYMDCPFVNKNLINLYKSIARIDGSGRYRMIFKIMTSTACNAVKKGYPISATELADIARQLDFDTAKIYQTRPLKVEADRAIEYAYRYAIPS